MQLVGYIDSFGSAHYVKMTEGQAANLASAQSGDRLSFMGCECYVDWTCSDGRLRLVSRDGGSVRTFEVDPDEVEAGDYLRQVA